VVTTSVSLWLHGHLNGEAGFADLLWPRFVLSVGLCFLYVPLTVLALSGLTPAQRGHGTGLFNLTRELGGSIGTAWMSQLLSDRAQLHAVRLSEHLGQNGVLDEPLALVSRLAAGRTTDPGRLAYAFALQRMQAQALIQSFDDAFVLVAAAFALGLLLLPLLGRARAPGQAALLLD
jgi:DHA2 family multidrug resistance protein